MVKMKVAKKKVVMQREEMEVNYLKEVTIYEHSMKMMLHSGLQ